MAEQKAKQTLCGINTPSKKSGKMVQLMCHKSFLKMIVISFGEDVGLTHREDHFKKLYGFFMPKIRKDDERILAEAKKFNQPIQTM